MIRKDGGIGVPGTMNSAGEHPAPTPTKVLAPWDDLGVHAEEGTLPECLRVYRYDGDSTPPRGLDDVEFYVLPYDRGPDPAKLISRMPALRVVQSLAAGVEDLVPLIPDGVVFANGRGLQDSSVAEHALGLILAMQREFPRWIRQQEARTWDRDRTRSLAGSRVLLVGHGSIGGTLARLLTAAEAQVISLAKTTRASERVYGIEALPSFLGNTDILILVLPETADTKGLIGAEELAALPDAALVVNVGRGSAIHQDALLAEVRTGRLRAALDVTEPEPLPPENPLWTAPGVLITPHVAGGSATFLPRARRLVIQQLHRFVKGEPLINRVR